jgi:hypothetical protein
VFSIQYFYSEFPSKRAQDTLMVRVLHSKGAVDVDIANQKVQYEYNGS